MTVTSDPVARQVDLPTDRRGLRFVTATSLFDGHDAAINIFRRILQSSGAEVIHLGHNRSVEEVAAAAIQEDADGVAITSYQGGHMEFFRYLRARLDDMGGTGIQVFGGGGGTILPLEAEALATEGTARLYSPDDGRTMGLQGMVDDMVERAAAARTASRAPLLDDLSPGASAAIARAISVAEDRPEEHFEFLTAVDTKAVGTGTPVLGITGTGGAGKSSLVDELVLRTLLADPEITIAVISVDPSRRRTGGALLGDRIRMNAIDDARVFMRSLATRQANLALSPAVHSAISIVKAAGFDLVILETSGIGQSDTEIVDHCDVSLYVMTPEYGAASQLEKIDMLDFADFVVINKSDKQGALDALRDVRKQYRRNRGLWDGPDEDLPIHSVVASRFNDAGVTALHRDLMERLSEVSNLSARVGGSDGEISSHAVVPPERTRYLSEISDSIRSYNEWVEVQAGVADRVDRLQSILEELEGATAEEVSRLLGEATRQLDPANSDLLEGWDALLGAYEGESHSYRVRGNDISVDNHVETLSGTKVPKIALPRYRAWGDRLRWLLQENVPGEFPFTAGVFPYKRRGEDPTRMFAGEGGAEQTNRRFHYLSEGMPAIRLSTAFDSVTLYGEDPDERPDIYGKVGNSGVSVSTLDDAKKLYSGFDLCHPATSVSMTINGPAPIMLAFFLNAAIDQQCEKYIVTNGLEAEVETRIAGILGDRVRPTYHGPLPPGNDGLGLMLLGVSGDQVLPADTYAEIRDHTLRTVRGTIQADILKEDQAQNTCIFSTEFSLRMMGDIQEWFIEQGVRNFYSVSISGYHMAEAGANPISQLAFTLANGFTYVEYYLSRGMHIDAFAPSLSFFFSNGIDPEYAVIGRVARRIWAKAMRLRYQGGELSQRLKYHIQTSGRSLHAQEIGFNDIRTTLQALYAVYDNCNSLHTNAYDEAITTPTEESVRRALAIQLIINRELGLAKNENPLQGSFIIEELTDLVEEAVLAEFDRLTSRGGVLGAMERQYQRTKIQDESMKYERQKESGAYPIIGVNTFLSPTGSPFVIPEEVTRSTDEDKDREVANLRDVHARFAAVAPPALADLQRRVTLGGNAFGALMNVAKVASIGQISGALYAVGGRYRRNM